MNPMRKFVQDAVWGSVWKSTVRDIDDSTRAYIIFHAKPPHDFVPCSFVFAFLRHIVSEMQNNNETNT